MAMQVNKINARKEFFRVSLADIRSEIDKLKQGEDFTIKHWTDKANATEYKDTLDIENDAQKKEKWLVHRQAMTDRQLKLDMLRLPLSPDAEANEENQED